MDQVYNLQVNIIKANSSDFKIYKGFVIGPGDVPIRKYGLKYGIPYFIKSEINQNFEGVYIFSDVTDLQEFTEYLNDGMIYKILPKT